MSTRDALAALAGRLAQLDALPTAERERARTLVHDLLEAHAGALRRLLDAIGTAPGGVEWLNRAAGDPDIAALLMLHGLHPRPLRERVEAAVEALAPRLAAQHAHLELIGVDDAGRIQLRLEHRGARGALHGAIEEALALAAADANDLAIDETITVPLRLERTPRQAHG